MIVRILLAALAAGLLAGLLITPVQYARVIPLILHAETFEGDGAPAHDHAQDRGERSLGAWRHQHPFGRNLAQARRQPGRGGRLLSDRTCARVVGH